MSKFFLTLVLAAVFLSASVSAQETVMELSEAVEAAILRNPGLEQMRSDSEIALWDQRIATSAYLPHLHASFSSKYYHDNPFLPYDENYQLDLMVRQSIINVREIAEIGRSSSMRESYKELLRAYEQNITYEVVLRFYRALLDQRKKEIRANALALAAEEKEVAEKRYAGGELSYYELLRSEATYLSAEAEKNRAEAEYNKSMNSLKEVLGYGPGKNLTLEGDLSSHLKSVGFRILSKELDSSHPSIAAADHQVEYMRRGVISSRAEFFPNLDLELLRSSAKHSQFAGAGKWDEQWGAYLRVSFPIFEGARRYFRVKRAREDLKKSESQKKELVIEKKKEIDSFYQDHGSALKLVESQKKNLSTSRELYDLVRKRYALGKASEIELLDAHINLIDVESSYDEAKYQVIVSYYGMLLSAGRLDREVINEN